jgi:hypothetical protein
MKYSPGIKLLVNLQTFPWLLRGVFSRKHASKSILKRGKNEKK